MSAKVKPIRERPAAVPPDAEFNTKHKRWLHGRTTGEGEWQGRWRIWTEAGVLVEEAEFAAGQRDGLGREFHESNGTPSAEGRYRAGQKVGLWRCWREDGTLAQEAHYLDDEFDGIVRDFDDAGQIVVAEVSYCRGLKEGACRLAANAGDFRNPAVVTEAGCYLNGAPIGVWFLHDKHGAAVGRLDYGLPRGPDADFRKAWVLSEIGRTPHLWKDLEGIMIEGRRPGEALCAAVRGAAEGGQVADLVETLARLAPMRGEESARSLAAAAVADAEGDVFHLLDALAQGAEPVTVLQALALALDAGHRPHAALDFANAAKLLAPLRLDLCHTRAVGLIGLGRVAEARRELERLTLANPEAAASMTIYLAVQFPIFDFWPARDIAECEADGLPDEPVRELSEVRDAVKRYATRMMAYRVAMIDICRTPDAAWLPPDLTSLLPEGPVAGATPELPASLTALLGVARADWLAVSWLCWSVGLTDVALPDTVRAPLTFGLAAGMICQRAFWLADKAATGGARALRHGIGPFTFEGRSVETLDPGFLEMAAGEYRELQAVILWLSRGDAPSLWDEALRDDGNVAAWTAAVPKPEAAEVPSAFVRFEVFLPAEPGAFSPVEDLAAAADDTISWHRFDRVVSPERFTPPDLGPARDREHTFRFPRRDVADLAARVQAATICYEVTGNVQEPEDFEYLVTAVRLTAALAKHGGGIIVDRTSGIGYTQEEFAHVAENLGVRDTVAVVMEGNRVETRGMSKYGNRDFVLEDFPTEGNFPEIARRWLYDNLCQSAAFNRSILAGETLGYKKSDETAKLFFSAGADGKLLVTDCHPERKEPISGLKKFLATVVPMFEEHLRKEAA